MRRKKREEEKEKKKMEIGILRALEISGPPVSHAEGVPRVFLARFLKLE